MKIKKQNIFEKFNLVDEFDSNKFKTSIFKGKIFIPQGFSSLLSLIIEVENYFLNYFNFSINEFVKDNSIILNEEEIIKFQKLIKQSESIYKKFIIFLKDLDFEIHDTYCDQMTIRFSPSINEDAKGLLKPVKPHRDTWASNFQHQINWWIPLHSLSKQNSIFFIPKYFTKRVKNNSKDWSFKLFKQGHIKSSTPVSLQNFSPVDYKTKKLNLGDAFCFSGNQIHGSKLGRFRRLNLETRTLCTKDLKRFHIPKSVDNNNLIKQGKWFRSLHNSKFYMKD
tara:strand:- start:284 stop:1123 length:840 start_codon:yes stop_codon:yes gene_type:complete